MTPSSNYPGENSEAHSTTFKVQLARALASLITYPNIDFSSFFVTFFFHSLLLFHGIVSGNKLPTCKPFFQSLTYAEVRHIFSSKSLHTVNVADAINGEDTFE